MIRWADISWMQALFEESEALDCFFFAGNASSIGIQSIAARYDFSETVSCRVEHFLFRIGYFCFLFSSAGS